MLAISDVHAGDVIDIRVQCRDGEGGTATVNVAILDDALFRLGYEILNSSTMKLTSFSNTLVEGTINCTRDGLLYTSIPQNGNWIAEVDGQEQEIVLVGDCMIGLQLSQGAHTLRFIYRNEAFRLSCIITAVCAGIFALLVLICYRPKRIHPEPQEPECAAAERMEPALEPENEMPPLIPDQALPAEEEEPAVLEELTRPSQEAAGEQPGDETATEMPEEPPEAE